MPGGSGSKNVSPLPAGAGRMPVSAICGRKVFGRICMTGSRSTRPSCGRRSILRKSIGLCCKTMKSVSRQARSICSPVLPPWRWGWISPTSRWRLTPMCRLPCRTIASGWGAGRRGEPWAFAMTFCRDLPLDHAVFQNPLSFLTARIAAPAVRLDSVPVVARHVHAALLAAFLRASSKGLDIKTSAGAFFGATEDVNAPVTEDNPADTFLIRLRDPDFVQAQTEDLSLLVRDTALKRREAAHLCAETAEAIEKLLQRW